MVAISLALPLRLLSPGKDTYTCEIYLQKHYYGELRNVYR